MIASSSIAKTSEENQYALDEELYNSSVTIRDEMNLMNERLAKMEEHKNEISEAVYLRVKSDYLAKQNLIKKEFEEKKKEIRKALLVLYKGQREQENNLQKHREVLEEAKFRNVLGEYSDKKAKEIENKETVEIKQYDHLLSLIQTNIKQYEELMGGPVQEIPEGKQVKEEKIDQEEYLGNEGNYFELEGDLFGEISGTVKKEKKKKEPEKNFSEEPEKSISSVLKDIPLDTSDELTGHMDMENTKQSTQVIPSPLAKEKTTLRAKLVSIEGDLQPPEIELGENSSLGRSPSNDIVLKEAKISRQHAAIQLQGNQHILVDLKSSNGIFVNGEKVEEHVLQDGDEISIGSYRFLYRRVS